jgi:hypothetical protein
MTDVIRFDYKVFFEYWSNFARTCNAKQPCYFYPRTPYRNQQPKLKYLNTIPLEIEGIQVYVQVLRDELLFTTPIEIEGRLWDFHYHVSVTKRFLLRKENRHIDAVYFHRTIQKPQVEGKEHINCYFENLTPLNDVENIVCKERTTHATLSSVFPNEMAVIKAIITAPSYNNTSGGAGKKQTRKFVIGRLRKITKVGRKSFVTYKGDRISLTEARSLEKQLCK